MDEQIACDSAKPEDELSVSKQTSMHWIIILPGFTSMCSASFIYLRNLYIYEMYLLEWTVHCKYCS